MIKAIRKKKKNRFLEKQKIPSGFTYFSKKAIKLINKLEAKSGSRTFIVEEARTIGTRTFSMEETQS